MQKQSIFQYVLIAALIVGAFYMGSLKQKVAVLEKGGSATGAGNGTAKAGGTTPEVAVFDPAQLSAMAKNINLNVSDFEKCLNSSEIIKEVSDEAQAGAVAGIQGTPGVMILDNQTGNVVVAPGAVPITMLKDMFAKLVAGPTAAEKTAAKGQGIEYTDKTTLKLEAVNSKDYVRGTTNARYTLIEYSDYECPYCKKFQATAVQFINDNKDQMNWVYRQFPLPQLHANAEIKSQAARCAGKLGGADAFWSFSDAFLTSN